MILKNYYKLLAGQMHMSSNKSNVTVIRYDGNTYNVGRLARVTGTTDGLGYACHLINSLGFYGLSQPLDTVVTDREHINKVIFGSGDTPVSLDDYKLSGNIVTGISSTATCNVSVDDNGVTITAVHTIVNNNDSAVTIKEAAYVGAVYSSQKWEYAVPVLLDRTVLEEPVTIEAGGVAQITYTIKLKYPV